MGKGPWLGSPGRGLGAGGPDSHWLRMALSIAEPQTPQWGPSCSRQLPREQPDVFSISLLPKGCHIWDPQRPSKKEK